MLLNNHVPYAISVFAGSATQNTLQDGKSHAYGFALSGRHFQLGYLNLGHPSDGVKTDGMYGLIQKRLHITRKVFISGGIGPYVFAATIPTAAGFQVRYGAALFMQAQIGYNLTRKWGASLAWDRVTIFSKTVYDTDVFLVNVTRKF